MKNKKTQVHDKLFESRQNFPEITNYTMLPTAC